MYSEKIANAMKDYLEHDNWNYDFNEERGVFQTGISIDCKVKKIKILIAVEEEMLQVIAPIGMNADKDRINDVAEYITRANYGVKVGKFELDCNDGEIRYQLAVDCAGGMIPNEEILARSIRIPALMYQRYGDGLLEVMFGFSTPKDAVIKAEM